MAKKQPPLSEAEELESFLKELEGEVIKEIAGWESGFPGLSRSLNGILPGLYLLIGPPSCGKSAFAKQLCDQVATQNSVPAIFFTFAESKKDLRIRTLARLSGLENSEIRKGSAHLLHWYGVPKGRITDPEQLSPSWEKLKRQAEVAKGWLDLLYIVECSERTDFGSVKEQICQVKERRGAQGIFVVIDDSQRLGPVETPFDTRLLYVVERFQGMAVDLQAAIVATWPDLRPHGMPPQEWGERVPGADVILALEKDVERSKNLTEPNRAMTLYIVKNRGGERSTIAFDFSPAFSKWTEASPTP